MAQISGLKNDSTANSSHHSMEADLSQARRLEMLLADGSVWRMRDLQARGIGSTTVRRAVNDGWVEALSRGTYRKPDAPEEHGSAFSEVCARVPHGIICLLSAAEFHGLTDETPEEVWLAIGNDRHPARLTWPPVRTVRWRQPAAFEVGVEVTTIQGVEVRITNPARTVVDMLRMMSTVGDDRAMECLRDYSMRGGSVGEVRVIADRIGVGNRLTPYIKAIPYMEPRHEEHRGEHSP